MKLKLLAIIVFFLIAAVPILADEMAVDIRIAQNDNVWEAITVEINSTETYSSFEYETIEKPVSISADMPYEITEFNNSNFIAFYKPIEIGTNRISFSLLYDTIIQRAGKGKVFRASFAAGVDDIIIRLTLPEKHILAKMPSATPTPDRITTDGQKITLEWVFKSQDEAVIAVFYEGPKPVWPYTLIILAAAVLIAGAAYYISRHKVKKIVEETLGEDEQKVVALVRQGIKKQKEIAIKLDFSKSKMSKVMRKLEQKGLVEKTPFFKTNIIKLKKIK